MKEVRSITVHLFATNKVGKPTSFKMAVEVDTVPIRHERLGRTYTAPGDCLTSARHLVNEVTKGKS